MAKQIINIGAAPNDGAGDPLRTAYDKANDNFTELYDAVASLVAGQITAAALFRSEATESCDGSEDQVIAFSSQFVTNYALSIIDYNGIGIEVSAQDADGFTITSLSSGVFAYVATLEV